MNHEQLVELLKDSILNHIDLDSGGYSPPLDQQVGLIVDDLRPVLAQVWEDGLRAAMDWAFANKGGTGPINPYREQT